MMDYFEVAKSILRKHMAIYYDVEVSRPCRACGIYLTEAGTMEHVCFVAEMRSEQQEPWWREHE